MKIEKVNIDSVKVYPNNAKIHTAEQIEEIKKDTAHCMSGVCIIYIL